MSHPLISRNPVLQKLQSEGYELEVRGGLLLVHHVPYLDSEQNISSGILAMPLTLAGDNVIKPSDHTVHWIGKKPCGLNGEEVPTLINSYEPRWNNFEGTYFLSLKPTDYPNQEYPDYYSKVKLYFQTIAGHAIAFDADKVKALPHELIEPQADSVFAYQDTNSSKAGILGVTEKIEGLIIAIVGIGGTGSYLLDLVSKMPFAEIHIYDDDVFLQHNAFRSPGAPTKEEIGKCMHKVEYFQKIYSAMHKHIIPHSYRIDDTNISELRDMDMVFLCVDKVSARVFISRHLVDNGVNFIDSGLGLALKDDTLVGQLRVTSYFGGNGDYLKDIFGTQDAEDDGVYASNIQIAMLNSWAAMMMLEIWLKHRGFLGGDKPSNHVVYNIGMRKRLTASETK